MAFITQSFYLDQVIRLSLSLVIKLDAVADVMNQFLINTGHPVDKNDPTTWIYYRHLSGNYHETDTTMRVTSLDTLEDIDFTYDTLRFHRATYNAYQEKGQFYDRLVAEFPEQIDLIDGILNPVDINIAIGAENFTILTFDSSAVSPNETNLIPKLQRFITGFSDTWYNANYRYLFDEYPAIFMNTLYTFIPGEILNIRKLNIRTEYVHDYHLWAYLGSHQRIDKYRDYLTREQVMWLYRNIQYLESHPGWHHSFNELIEWLLTKRNIPLTELVLAHNVEDLQDTLSPNTEIIKRQLNAPAYSSAGEKKETIANTLAKEIPLAEGNVVYYDDQVTAVPERFSLSPYSSLHTKVLESDMVDRSDSQPVHYINTVFNEWFFLASTGRYTAMVTVTNPYTSDVMSMTAKEAAMVWVYCLHRMLDMEIDQVPTILVHDVMRPIAPTYAELREMSPRIYVSEDMILTILEEHVPQGSIVSVEKFQDIVTQIHNARTRLRYLFSVQESFPVRGHVENVTRRLFQEYRCSLVNAPTYYADFFKQKGWAFGSLTALQYQDFANDIFILSTGLDLKRINSVRAIQEAMLQLLQQLSSYSIQFLSRITDSEVTVLDRVVIRPGEVTNASALIAREKVNTHVVSVTGQGNSRYLWGVGNGVEVDDTRVRVKGRLRAEYPITVSFTANSKVSSTRRVKLPLARIHSPRTIPISDYVTQTALEGIRVTDPTQGQYDKVTDALWWDYFIKDNPNVDYQQNQVTLRSIGVNSPDDPDRNTKGKLMATPGMGREGAVWVTWNRPHMEEMFNHARIWIAPDQQKTLMDVIEAFNAQWKFKLTPRDIFDQPIDTSHLPLRLDIAIRPTCLCFQGTLTLWLGEPEDDETPVD